MSNHYKRHCIVLMYLIAFFVTKGQTANNISSTEGIWQDYGTPLSAKTYPEFHGRLVNVNWSDIETSNNTWDWTVFDSDVTQHTANHMPVIVLVYTGPNAPGWIYSNGVPKVNATDSSGNIVAYSPYYLDSDYNYYFKRMISVVSQHILVLSFINKKPDHKHTRLLFKAQEMVIAYKGIVPSKY